MGKSHVVIPSSNDEVALTDESLDQNTQSRCFHSVRVVQFPRLSLNYTAKYIRHAVSHIMIPVSEYCLCCAVFYGLCETLFKLDQGLVCSSTCNTETMKIGTLACYYLLQPSEKGPMLLRVQSTSHFYRNIA
jgi:hypothetical protein